ncbi:MAG: hypothetical protein O2820_07235 [Planctomycetota bacterium]|nr:hypothetical protein [Planctomycetota bacterium]MDA1249003.1 hypothetical protein [Planctomycetota bacterium]
MKSLRRNSKRTTPSRITHPRSGAVSTLDYILGLCVVFPLIAFAVPTGKKIIQFTYEMICVLIAWPFM